MPNNDFSGLFDKSQDIPDENLVKTRRRMIADLSHNAAFRDMQLHLEFNVEPKSNSGVYLRGRYEVQILDNPDAKMALDTHGCGAIYSRLAPMVDAAKPEAPPAGGGQ